MRVLIICFVIVVHGLSCGSHVKKKEKCSDINPYYLQIGVSRWVIHENGKYGFIDREGIKVISCEYDTVCEFSPSIALIKNNGRFFYIDTTGKKLFDRTFEAATPFFDEKIAAVAVEGKWGMIDTTGKFVVAPIYDSLAGYNEGAYLESSFFSASWPTRNEVDTTLSILGTYVTGGFVGVCKNGKWGMWSLDEKRLVVNTEMDEVSYWSEGMLAVRKGKYWGFCDSIGKMVTSFEFDKVFTFHEGFAVVNKGNVCGNIDRTGKMIISPRYKLLWSYSNGLAAEMTYEDNLYRYIDKKGKIAFRDSFENVTDFRHQVAMVSKNKHYYLIDTKGNRLNELVYDETYAIHENGTIVVSRDGKWGIINVCGEEIVPIKYDETGGVMGGMAEVNLDGKWGFVNIVDDEIIPPRYDKVVRSFDNGVAMVSNNQNGKTIYQYINTKGEVIWSGE